MQSLISQFTALTTNQQIAVVAIIATIVAALLPGFLKLLWQLLSSPFKNKPEATKAATTVSTKGDNSPTIHAGGDAHVVIKNYHGANAVEVERLQKELDLSNAAIKPLLQLLSIKHISLEKRTERFAELANQYKALQERLKQYEKGDEFAQKAEYYLEEGKLAEAENALEAANDHDLKQVEERKKDIAKRTFDLASISELQLDYDKAIQRYQSVIEYEPNNLEAWQNLAQLSQRMGNTRLALLNWQGLQKNAEKQQEERWHKIGLMGEADILQKQGNSTQAIQKYQQAHQYFQELVKSIPNNLNWQRDLSISFVKIGDIHKANVSNDKATQAYQSALKIVKKITVQDSSNNDWQRDLSICFSKLGDIYKADSNYDDAIQSYKKALIIQKKLAKYDPNNSNWKYVLGISQERLGDIFTINDDNEKALACYQKRHKIISILVKHDPNNLDWQRDLSVSHNKLGDIFKTNEDNDNAIQAYQDALAIRKSLAKHDPSNFTWQRDLSVSYNKLGDIFKTNKDNDNAIQAYQDALAIRKSLAKQSPKNSDWQRDLSISFERIGDIHQVSGDFDSAIQAYQSSLDIIKALIKLEPKRYEWKIHIAATYSKFIAPYSNEKNIAREYAEKGLTVLEKLYDQKQLPAKSDWRKWFREQLIKLE